MVDLPSCLIVHETWGRTYYSHLEAKYKCRYFVPSFFRAWARELVKPGKFPFSYRRFAFWGIARLWVSWVYSGNVLIAIAPYDYRLLYMIGFRLRRRSVRVVYHTSWHDWNGAVPRRVFGAEWLMKRYFKWFLNSNNVVVTAVTKEAASSVASFLCRNDVQLIPHPVSLEAFSPGARAEKTVVGFVGQLTHEKGVEVVLRMAHALSGHGIGVEIVGGGPLEPRVREACRRNGSIFYHGRLDYPNGIARTMRKWTILVLPSKRNARWEELFGRVIIEAWASGVVVIASDHVGPRSIIVNNENGILVSEADHSSIEDIVMALLKNKIQMESLRDAGLKSAESFRLEAIVARWQGAFNECGGSIGLTNIEGGGARSATKRRKYEL